MAIIAESTGSGKTFEPMEAGSYVARCYSMIHIGTSVEKFQGEDKTQNKVQLTFEFPTEMKVFKEENGPQPMVLSKDFTLSMHEKSTLRKFLGDWRGKAFTDEEAKSFDITKLLGVECQISVSHKVSEKDGKTYANIAGVSRVMKGMTVPPQINPTFEFNYSPFDQAKFDSLSDYVKDKIRKTDEYKAATSGGATVAPSAAPDAQKFEQAAPAPVQSKVEEIIAGLSDKTAADWDTVLPTLPKDLTPEELETIKSSLLPF